MVPSFASAPAGAGTSLPPVDATSTMSPTKNDAGAVFVGGSAANTSRSPNRNTAAHSAMIESRINAVSIPLVIHGRCRSIRTAVCGSGPSSWVVSPSSSRKSGGASTSSTRAVGVGAAVSVSMEVAPASAVRAVAVKVTGRSISEPRIIRGPRTSTSTSHEWPASSATRSGVIVAATIFSGSDADSPTSNRVLPLLATITTKRAVRCARTIFGRTERPNPGRVGTMRSRSRYSGPVPSCRDRTSTVTG